MMAQITITIPDKDLTKLDRLVNFLEKFLEANVTGEASTTPVKPLKKETKKERIARVGREFEAKQAKRRKRQNPSPL